MKTQIGLKLPLWNTPPEGTPSPESTPTPAPQPTPTNTDPAPATPPAASLLGTGVESSPAPEAGKEGEGDRAAPTPAVPLTIADIALPEGVEVDQTVLASALDVMNDEKLTSKERLQKLVDLQVTAAQAQQTAQVAAWESLQTQWRGEVEGLADLGGAALPETLAQIRKGLAAVGADQSYYDAMTLTGAGNNPAIIRIMHALTKPFAEGKSISGAPPKGPMSPERVMYPTMQPKE